MGRKILRLIMLAVSASAMVSSAAWAAQGDLVVHVRNLSPAGGILRLGVYDEANYPNDDSNPVASADADISGTEVTVVLHGIRPGDYAIEAFQDVHRDGKMDTSLLGIPKEPFGFSRDVRPSLAKPSFSSVKFTISPGENIQTIHLQSGISLVP
jgi:uncharacterized protein (DUF2141 family)